MLKGLHKLKYMPTAAATITGGKNIGFPLPLKSGNFTLLYIIQPITKVRIATK